MSKLYREALTRAGLPPMPFHGLRHTFATMHLLSGTPMKVVSDLLGHSNILMTMDLYSHVVPELRDEAAQRLDALFSDLAQLVDAEDKWSA